MTEPRQQPVYYVVFSDIGYPSIIEALNAAPQAIAAHKKRSQEWQDGESQPSYPPLMQAIERENVRNPRKEKSYGRRTNHG